MSVAYMELCLKSCPPSFSVLLFQFLNGTGESWGWDLSISTGERLQDSIMDEHILVLGGSQSLGQLIMHKILFGPMNSFSFSTQLLFNSWITLIHKTPQIKMLAICVYSHNSIIRLLTDLRTDVKPHELTCVIIYRQWLSKMSMLSSYTRVVIVVKAYPW